MWITRKKYVQYFHRYYHSGIALLKKRKCSMESSYYITDCPGRGRGVYANKPFKAKEFIMKFSGKETPINEISDFTHYLQISPDHFLGPSGTADDYVNHSCDPNCALFFENDELVLRSIKDITPGEELNFDYGTIQFTEPTTFQCVCGSPLCRGMVSNFYALPEKTRQYYLENNMVPLLSRYTLEEIECAATKMLVA